MIYIIMRYCNGSCGVLCAALDYTPRAYKQKKRNENRYNAFFKIFKFDENFKKEEAMGVDKVLQRIAAPFDCTWDKSIARMLPVVESMSSATLFLFMKAFQVMEAKRAFAT